MVSVGQPAPRWPPVPTPCVTITCMAASACAVTHTRVALGTVVPRRVRREHLRARLHWERNCVKNALGAAGFGRTGTRNWNVYWGKHLSKSQYKRLLPHQKVHPPACHPCSRSSTNCRTQANHFPGTWAIGRKDRLARCMRRMRREFGQEFDFVPPTYTLPGDAEELARAVRDDEQVRSPCAAADARATAPSASPLISACPPARLPAHARPCPSVRPAAQALWIRKPCASSCGRGIRVLTREAALRCAADSVRRRRRVLVQGYVRDPLLIRGSKFDLRLYVAVTSFEPLCVYLYQDGLARFCTEKFSLSARHLTDRCGAARRARAGTRHAA